MCEKARFDVIEIRFDSLTRYLVSNSLKEIKSFFENSRITPRCMGGHFILPNHLSGNTREEKERDAAIMTMSDTVPFALITVKINVAVGRIGV